MTTVQLTLDGQQIFEQSFETRGEADVLVNVVRQQASFEWEYDAEANKWTGNNREIIIVDGDLTDEELLALVNAKIATAEGLKAKIEQEIVAKQAKVDQLNAGLTELYAQRENLE